MDVAPSVPGLTGTAGFGQASGLDLIQVGCLENFDNFRG